MSRVKVLISDDCTDYATLLSGFLSMNSDIQVVGIAEDGVQTIEMLNNTTPDVLLLDLIMPNVDGLEVLRQINSQYGSHLSVIVISALSDEAIIKEALSLGAKRYLVKPFDLTSAATKITQTEILHH